MGFIYKARHPNSNRLPCKGSWTRVHERTEGLKGIALFIQIPYAPKKSLRLACGNPPPFTRGAKSGLKSRAQSI